MADKILHKRSLITGSVPTTASLAVGELALNVPDGKAFIRKSGSAGDEIISLVTVNSVSTGSVSLFGDLTVEGQSVYTGSIDVTQAVSASQFSGSGANLFDISASAVIGLNLSLISSGSVTASISPVGGFVVNTDTSISGSTQISGGLTLLNGLVVSGSTVLTGGLSTEGDVTIEGRTTLTGSLNVTGAIVGTNNARLTGSVGVSGSFNVYGNSILSGTLEVTNAITGNLDGTSSYNVSSSYALTSSYVSGTTGILNDLVVTGTASISFINTSIISSSISYSSGSNIIGNTLGNTQAITGSTGITGSFTMDSASRATIPNLTGSLHGTASYAITASYIKAEGVDGLNLTLISSGSATASISPVRGLEVNIPSFFSGSVSVISGTFSGSGADLYDISQSSIVGLNLSIISSGSITASVSPVNGFRLNTDAFISGNLSVSGGVFSGSGRDLYDISASGIVGLNLSRISSGSVTASITPTDGFTVNTKAAISGNLGVSGGVITVNSSGVNIFGTASNAVSAAYAFTVAAPPGNTVSQTFGLTTTWSFQHNLGTFYPALTIYDLDKKLIIPEQVVNTSVSTSVAYFSYAQAGTLVATVGGGLPTLQSSYAGYVLTADSNGLTAQWRPAASGSGGSGSLLYQQGFTGSTWVANHNFNTTGLLVQCFNSNGTMFFPDDIRFTDLDNVTVTVGIVKEGYVVIK